MIYLDRRGRSLVLLAVFVAMLALLGISYRQRIGDEWREHVLKEEQKAGDDKPQHPPWVYKPKPEKADPIIDNFPLAASSRANIPPIAPYNAPPDVHVPEKTPLFIGFTRNWRLLQQVVVSYITAGWPAADIYVVDNTGTMRSNEEGRLSLQNPFYLDYKRLTQTFGVNVMRTPTLFNFAQLQNFYLSTALDKGWQGYFWSHMDVVAVSDESKEDFKSLYMRALEQYRESFSSDYIRDHKWAVRWFSYDRLSLVNTAAYADVGGWDTFIGYYLTDCDMHERLYMAGYETPTGWAGGIWDVGSSLDDLLILYRRDGDKAAEKNDDSYRELFGKLDAMQRDKNERKEGRNFWQGRQQGGQHEPFYRDHAGFEEAIQTAISQGREMYANKWGHRNCDLRGSGLKPEDAWRVEKDF